MSLRDARRELGSFMLMSADFVPLTSERVTFSTRDGRTSLSAVVTSPSSFTSTFFGRLFGIEFMASFAEFVRFFEPFGNGSSLIFGSALLLDERVALVVRVKVTMLMFCGDAITLFPQTRGFEILQLMRLCNRVLPSIYLAVKLS